MPTIKDVARAAGVSHATVSNVLNHKGNVSAKKVKLVMDAAAAMGYRVNEAASALRSGKAQLLAVILPDTGCTAYADLYRALCQAAAERSCGVLLRLTNNVPGTELKAIQDVLAARARWVVVVSSLPEPAQHYQALQRSGTEVVFALRGRYPGYLSAQFDLGRAARELARRACSDGARSIGLMTDMTCYPAHAAFRDEFLAAVGDTCPVKCVESVASQYTKQAFALFGPEGPDAVAVTCAEMAQAVDEAGRILGRSPRIYALSPLRVTRPTRYTAYELDHRELGLALGRMLTGKEEHRDLTGRTPGFSPVFSTPLPVEERTLSLLTADTPVIRALEILLPRLKRDTGLSLSITARPAKEFGRVFSRPEELAGYDLARMDLTLLDRWGAERFLPLEELGDTGDLLPRLLPGLEREYSLAGGRPVALPLDPGCHLLFYREDIFHDPHIQRRYLESCRESLTIPAHREQFAQTARFFAGLHLSDYGVEHPVTLTGNPSEYLSELSCLSESGDWPVLTQEMLGGWLTRRRMLEQAAHFSADGSWSRAVAGFARGESAMLVAHSHYARCLADDPLCAASGRVGFAPSPGGRAFLGGGCLGVLRGSAHREEAAVLLDWLFSPEIGLLLALLSGCSPLEEAYRRQELTDIYPWLDTVRSGLTGGRRRQLLPGSLTHPDQTELEQQIAALCARAVRENGDPARLLAQLRELGV